MGQATFPDALDALITLGKEQGTDWGDMIEALQLAAEGLDAGGEDFSDPFDDSLVFLRFVKVPAAEGTGQ